MLSSRVDEGVHTCIRAFYIARLGLLTECILELDFFFFFLIVTILIHAWFCII